MGLFMGIFNLSVVIPQIIVSGFFGKFLTMQPTKRYFYHLYPIAGNIGGTVVVG